MAEREALWDRDLDDPPTDLDDRHASNGSEPITEPIPVVEDDYDVPGYAEDDDVHPTEIGRDFSYAGPFLDRSRRNSPINSLTFKPAAPPWYRTKAALIALLAIVVVAVALSILPLVLRNPAPGTKEPTRIAPSTSVPAPSSDRPTENSVQPTLTSPPAPPPPPPPAPPPSNDSPPVVTRQYNPAPRYDTPSEPSKPEVEVTRAPMSVAPEERTAPTTANPDGKPRRGFF
jgi:hypothetical protein